MVIYKLRLNVAMENQLYKWVTQQSMPWKTYSSYNNKKLH